jgi:hypothetical protein
VGQANTLSVAIFDDQCLGCLLESRAVASLGDLVLLLETIPASRIVAIQGKLSNDAAAMSDSTESLTALLPSFQPGLAEEGILYIGQVQMSPDWVFCGSFAAHPDGHRIELDEIPPRDI